MFDCHVWTKIEDSAQHYWEEERSAEQDHRSESELYADVEGFVRKTWGGLGLPDHALSFDFLNGVVFMTAAYVQNHPSAAPQAQQRFMRALAKRFPKSYGTIMMHSDDDWATPGEYLVLDLKGGRVSDRRERYVA
jgi:hypothetical protein